MGLPDRIYRAAKAHLDQALERWDQIDQSAQQELEQSLQSPALSAWDRAQAKIGGAQAARELGPAPGAPVPLAETAPAGGPAVAPASNAPLPATRPSSTVVETAYAVLGVAPGSDFACVRAAYIKLKERASPERFPAGSPDQARARDIERRINAAYMNLMDALAPTEDRFDRLEL